MKKFLIIISAIFIIASIIAISKNKISDSNYNASFTSYEENITNNTTIENELPKEENNSFTQNISSFTTKIYDKAESRQNNIRITSNALNGKIINPGEEFSFLNIVGKSTKEKGYQKAKIFDENGNVIQGYGGGNCQVSSTIYNAVKNIENIEITERHNHNNKVPYIEQGLDAAVCYNIEDFKFINHNNYPIMININPTEDNITVDIKK